MYFNLEMGLVKVLLGNKKYNDRKKTQAKTCTPKFYEIYEFIVEFPGAPVL